MRKVSKITAVLLLICLIATHAVPALASATSKPAPNLPQIKPQTTATPAQSPTPTPAPAKTPAQTTDPASANETAKDGVYQVEQFGTSLVISYQGYQGSDQEDFKVVLMGEIDVVSESRSVYLGQELTAYDGLGIQMFQTDLNTECDDLFMGFHVVDLNFDGYLDIMVAYSMGGAHGNYWYYAYLWDQDEGTFVENVSFTEICNATVDPERERILSVAADSAFDMYYAVYSFIDGYFVLEAELFCEYGRDMTKDGKDIWRTAEYEYENGEAKLLSELEFIEGDPPKAYQLYLKEGSYWDLDNPVWISGDHYVTRFVGVDPQYVGYWHDLPFVPSGFSGYYWFSPDGTFVYGYSEMDKQERERYLVGSWTAIDGVLTLTVKERVYLEGGELAETGTDDDEMELVDYRTMLEFLDEPYDIVYELGEPGWDSESNRATITIGGETYYNFNNQTDLLFHYYDVKSDAAVKIEYIDAKTPFEERSDEDLLIIDDAYGNPFPYVRGVVEKSMYYHDGMGLWITYYYVQLSPKQYDFYYNMTEGISPEPETDKYCEVQVFGYDSIDISDYIGREIVFIGSPYEGNTIYHRRHIMVAVTEIVEPEE